MTAPRDAIVGKIWPGCQCKNCRDAATIAALQAKVKEQQNGMETLAKEHLVLARDYDALQARVKELEAERDWLRERNHQVASIAVARLQRIADAQSRATSAEQERDEALECLKPFADAADDIEDKVSDKTDIWEAPCAMQIEAGHLRAARDCVRRFAPQTTISAPASAGSLPSGESDPQVTADFAGADPNQDQCN